MNQYPPVAPPGVRLGVVRGISYGMFGAPDSFVPEMRKLGGTLVRVYVYWGQIEPEPGRYDWTVVDAILGQLDPADEVWVTVCSSSPWATRHPTGFLPSSPAHDRRQYERFVGDLVARCRGRVHYWQCNNEPSNTGLLWAGTAPEYVDQLTSFHRGVLGADPEARVVLGGCGYDVLAGPPGSPARQFFDHVVAHGRDAFDLFSVHLYGDPHHIPEQVESVREMMRRHGYERPVVAGEYNGPTLFEFPEAQAAFQQTMMAAFAGPEQSAPETLPADAPPDRSPDEVPDGAPGGSPDEAPQASHELLDEASHEPPDRTAMRSLYARMAQLPPQLQMFMEDCPPGLAAKRDRINCRQVVTRNILALAAGVTRTACWNLAPEIPGYRDRLNMMGFLFGRLALMDYDGTGRLTRRHPSADTFALVAACLDGTTQVRRLDAGGRPELYAFEVTRQGRGPLHVLWVAGDAFTGEDEPGTPVDWPWPHATVHALDAFGTRIPVEPNGGTVHLCASVTPLFLSTRPETSARP